MPSTVRTGRTRFLDPADGQLDLSRVLENLRGFLPVPVVATEPAVGYGGGAVGLFLRPREEAGVEGWARPHISAVGAIGTQNGTWDAFAGDASAGTGEAHLDFFGLGAADGVARDQPVRYALAFAGAVAQAKWPLAPGSPWALGLRYVAADVSPKLHEEPRFLYSPRPTG